MPVANLIWRHGDSRQATGANFRQRHLAARRLSRNGSGPRLSQARANPFVRGTSAGNRSAGARLVSSSLPRQDRDHAGRETGRAHQGRMLLPDGRLLQAYRGGADRKPRAPSRHRGAQTGRTVCGEAGSAGAGWRIASPAHRPLDRRARTLAGVGLRGISSGRAKPPALCLLAPRISPCVPRIAGRGGFRANPQERDIFQFPLAPGAFIHPVGNTRQVHPSLGSEDRAPAEPDARPCLWRGEPAEGRRRLGDHRGRHRHGTRAPR